MRQDQIDRLEDLAEEITDVFIRDADPANWSASDKTPKDMTKEERGDAHWCRKLAMHTGSLLARVLDLRDRDKEDGSGQRVPEIDADADIRRYEKQAKELIKAVAHGKVRKPG